MGSDNGLVMKNWGRHHFSYGQNVYYRTQWRQHSDQLYGFLYTYLTSAMQDRPNVSNHPFYHNQINRLASIRCQRTVHRERAKL